MDNSFFAYLQQLEMMGFFSGYPLLYAVIFFIAGSQQNENDFKSRLDKLLPFSYALIGTLFLGLQLKNLFPDYSISNIKQFFQMPWLTTWGLLAMLFWIPAIGKKTIFCLLHSLVFFYFLVRDVLLQTFTTNADKNIVSNEMKIYTDSLLLNLGAFAFITLLSFLFTRYKKR
jgi:hypothetical protein